MDEKDKTQIVYCVFALKEYGEYRKYSEYELIKVFNTKEKAIRFFKENHKEKIFWEQINVE